MEDFFALMQYAIGSRECFDKKLSEAQWWQGVKLAEKHALKGILYLAIERLNPSCRPPQRIILELYSSLLHIEKANRLLLLRCATLQEYLSSCGFQSCVLKGAGVASLYPKWDLRQSGDIDIWIKGEQEDVVALCRKFEPHVKPVFHNAPLSIFDNVSVEAHFTPNWMYWPASNRRMQRWFESQKDRQMQHRILVGNTEITAPTLAFNRIFILSHIYRHVFGDGIGLRQLLDYYYVLMQGFTNQERKDTLAVLKSFHMLHFTAAVMWVLQKAFALPDRCLLLAPDETEGRFLLNEIMQAGNFGAYDKRISTKDHAYGRFYHHVKRNMRFLMHYPYETLGTPLFKLWHFFWRKKMGYI